MHASYAAKTNQKKQYPFHKSIHYVINSVNDTDYYRICQLIEDKKRLSPEGNSLKKL
jgi:hypothetical protein